MEKIDKELVCVKARGALEADAVAIEELPTRRGPGPPCHIGGSGPMQSRQLKRQLSLSAIVFLISVWALFQIDINQTHTLLLPKPHFVSIDNENLGFLVNTKGCRIPQLDPINPLVKEFIFPDTPVVCTKNNATALVKSNLKSLYVDTSQLSQYGASSLSELKCCFKPFRRIKGPEIEQYDGEEIDQIYKWSKKCKPFMPGYSDKGEEVLTASPGEDFVKVQCFVNGTSVYVDFFAFVNVKLSEEIENGVENKKVSVLVIGIDAVSRLNLYRQMPKTVRLLKEKLRTVEFFGYNKVEDNTFPNLIPVLTGLSETELKDTCWPSSSDYFDNCTFLWNNYSDAGFRTAFGEDASWMGIFTYLKKGFKNPPTQYYLRTFNLVAEREVGHGKRMNANLCVGPRLNMDVILEIIAKYALTMLKKLSFGFFWSSSLTHDYLNLPRYGDDSFVELIQKLFEMGLFERSVVIFMSDHGIRWGDIRETYQGYLEERLPFLFVSYPKWFSDVFSTAVSNMKYNSRKLTTPFDLHETLKDLINLKVLKKSSLRDRSNNLVISPKLPRGISLFLPIPGERTCQDANISDHWCTCHQSTPVALNSTVVKKSVDTLLLHINSLIQDYRQCSKLSVNQVLHAREEVPAAHAEKKSQVWFVDYTIMVETKPGLGLFEATVRNSKIANTYQVLGTVSRINTYGNQSFCVPHYKLRLYCYCGES